MMSSCCTLRLKRRSALPKKSPFRSLTSANRSAPRFGLNYGNDYNCGKFAMLTYGKEVSQAQFFPQGSHLSGVPLSSAVVSR